jgi:hypothetical protein
MGVIHNPIIVEEKFEAIFSYLPDMKFSDSSPSYPVVFRYGDKDELLAFLNSSEKRDARPYPLIWLVYPYLEKHLKSRVELESVKLVLAVDTDKASQNPERIKQNYTKILMPLYGNVVKVLTKANIINIKHEFNVTKHPNYSEVNSDGTESETIDRWDALTVLFNCQIIDTCLKQINI